MKYGFDLDDTLTDTANVINDYAIRFDKEYLKRKGNFKTISNAKDYYYFADALDWNKENIKSFFEVYYLDILKAVKIKPFVKETLKTLKEKNNEIYIITSRRKRDDNIVETISKEWLANNEIQYDEIFINIKEKSKIINRLNIDIFIDDSYNNCVEVKENTDAKVYMIETTFNKSIHDKNISKIKNINELLKN